VSPENRLEKTAPPKAPKKAVFIKEAKNAFESYFEDVETAVEYRFETRFGGVFYLLNLGIYLQLYRDFTESLTAELDLRIWDFIALLGLEFLGARIKRDAVWDFLKWAAERENDDAFGREFDRSKDWRMPLEWLEIFPKNQKWRWSQSGNRLVLRHGAGFNVIDVAARRRAQNQLTSEAEVYRNYFSEIEKAPKSGRLKSRKWLKNLAEYLEKRLYLALNPVTPRALNALLFERRASVRISATHLEITFSLADLPLEIRFAGIDRDPGWIPAAGKFVYFHFV
jgi:hypothetical protein